MLKAHKCNGAYFSISRSRLRGMGSSRARRMWSPESLPTDPVKKQELANQSRVVHTAEDPEWNDKIRVTLILPDPPHFMPNISVI